MSKTNQELVYDICDRLSAEGKKISVQIVLDSIPSIKSKSTVHPHLQNWREDKERRNKAQQESVQLSKAAQSALADEILRHIKITNEKWEKCAEKAKSHRDEAIEDLKQTQDRYERSALDVEKLNSLLVEQRACLETKTGCLQHSLDEEKSRNEKLLSTNQELQIALESARIELAKEQGALETQAAQMLSLEKLNSEQKARIQLLEDKLRKHDQHQASSRLKMASRK
ncbi:DNA-binding protein [Vibrio breoganii]|uniref:DNA-binding protein n=1 Tax=Vibrio breoganii TaxID=553239 RepID=UPI0002D3ACC0|nr:DNA-binding protein [Vibrio breoganii]OEF86371.1 hypothetical protein B003_05020 [Vibrio breoganii 1C10]